MTGLVRKATLLTAAGVLVASAAFAGVPDPGHSTVPAGGITIVGAKTGLSDPIGAFSITVRDLANNPLNGASVVVDISGCPDQLLCSEAEQTASNPGLIVNCAAKTARNFTNASGVVSFNLRGGSQGVAITTGNQGRVFANGVLIWSPSIASPDLDGVGGLGPNDLSKLLTDFATKPNASRSDLDFTGAPLGPNDLSKLLTYFAAGNSAASCTTNCGP